MSSKKIALPNYPHIALLLQGGGALGSYQAGVYEGLVERGIQPNWVAGISIVALNCAIIAGNPPEKRVEQLHAFWNTICSPPSLSASMFENSTNLFGSMMAPMQNMMQNFNESLFSSMSAIHTLVKGQEGFFKPRIMAPGGGAPDTTSFYDTSPIISTLEKFADFDRINSGEIRVSLGATNVATGNFVYFDTKDMKLAPKHFLASGSLPPGFPATEIDGEFYWDGGCVSNTPLEYVLSSTPRQDTLAFQVDLWSAHGALPTNMNQITERLKEIQYSSRTRTVTNAVHLAQSMRRALVDTVNRIPAAVKEADPWFDQMVRHMMGARFNVIQLIYENKQSEGHFKDYQFSAETMQMHWQTGLHDMHETLSFPACLDMPDEGENFVTFDVHTHKRSSSSQFSSHGKEGATQPAAKVAVKVATKAAPPPPGQYIEKTPTKAAHKPATKAATKAAVKPVTKTATKTQTKVAVKPVAKK